jgi:glycosyltransferase involved in cell wall biosynthesis
MEARIRVLKCILDSRFGGPHRLGFSIARKLCTRGVETLFLFGYRGSRLEGHDDFEQHYFAHLHAVARKHPVINMLLFLCFLPVNIFRIWRLIKSRHIDVVDVDGTTNIVPMLAARLSGVPVVCCSNDHPPARVKFLLLPLLDWLTTRVIVQGERLRQSRTGSRPRLYAKTIVMHSCVDTAQFDSARWAPTARQELRRKWGVPPNDPLVGIVGNVNRLKGHKYFIEAAAQVKQRVTNAKFAIIGRRIDSDPGYWEDLHALIAQLGLGQDLIFTGYQENIPAVLNALDVFVLASVLESCPNVVLEAMAMKVPVVATDVGAVAELLGDGEAGIIVPPRDSGAIAEAVLQCLTKPADEIQVVKDTARNRVETEFALDRIAQRQMDLYEELSSLGVCEAGQRRRDESRTNES